MDISMLIEVHQYYINDLKSKLEKSKNNVCNAVTITAPQINANSTSEKNVNIYVEKLSCLENNIQIIDTNDLNIFTNSKTILTKNSGINTLPYITYRIPNDINIKSIIITRPACTSMMNAYIKVFDDKNTCIYESRVIQDSQCAKQVYTYNLPNPDPNVV